MRIREHIATVVCLLVLGATSFHFYRAPIYSMDMAGYMGNALFMGERDVNRVHDRVYAEMRREIPPETFALLTGSSGPSDQNESRRARLEHTANFAQFLPFFAIRPLYNVGIYFLGKVVGVIPAIRLISALSYFLMGALTFWWMGRYVPKYIAAAAAVLLMLTPPMMWIGRDTGSDALATLAAFLALYLIFERERFALGMVIMMVSLWIRTDNIVLLGPVLLVCWMQGRFELWKGAVLGVLAVASVLAINHFGGDYGIKMLYYRNFVGVPLAPAEMTVHISLRQYVSAFAAGIRAMVESYTTLVVLLGIAGWWLSPKARPLIAVSTASVILHYIILPNWQERWFGVFYLSMGIALVAALGAGFAGPQSRLLVMRRNDNNDEEQSPVAHVR
jgi:4-amino-4-deoxy-L-arabinose transferase-like glycosyltransferase